MPLSTYKLKHMELLLNAILLTPQKASHRVKRSKWYTDVSTASCTIVKDVVTRWADVCVCVTYIIQSGKRMPSPSSRNHNCPQLWSSIQGYLLSSKILKPNTRLCTKPPLSCVCVTTPLQHSYHIVAIPVPQEHLLLNFFFLCNRHIFN